MGRRRQWVYRIEREEFPGDFPRRLDRFRQAAGLTWAGLARLLRVNARTVRRWKAGARVGSGHLVKLLTLAANLGLLHLLLPEMEHKYVLAESGMRRADYGGKERNGLPPVISNFGTSQDL